MSTTFRSASTRKWIDRSALSGRVVSTVRGKTPNPRGVLAVAIGEGRGRNA